MILLSDSARLLIPSFVNMGETTGGPIGVFCTFPFGPYWQMFCDGGFWSPFSESASAIYCWCLILNYFLEKH